METVQHWIDRCIPGRYTNPLAYGLGFLACLSTLASLLWLLGYLTGGN